MPRVFHATFACEWRRYLYLMPLTPEDARLHLLHRQGCGTEGGGQADLVTYAQHSQWALIASEVNDIIQWLQGQQLNYYAFARSTPKGRSCICKLLHASAKLRYLPQGLDAPVSYSAAAANRAMLRLADPEALDCSDPASSTTSANDIPVVCIQLIGDRFVRRMVRTIAATAVMSALWNEPMRLRQAIESCERRDTAYPAPAAGLCFTGAGYGEEPPLPIAL